MPFGGLSKPPLEVVVGDLVVTRREAYKILGISPETPRDEIKKRYRQLMLKVHPDSGASSVEDYIYSAQEINIAYELLNTSNFLKEFDGETSYKSDDFGRKKGNAAREKEKMHGMHHSTRMLTENGRSCAMQKIMTALF